MAIRSTNSNKNKYKNGKKWQIYNTWTPGASENLGTKQNAVNEFVITEQEIHEERLMQLITEYVILNEWLNIFSISKVLKTDIKWNIYAL